KPGGSCPESVSASGSDADGDTLTYSWSGCASGTSASSTCNVASIGKSTATVTICDGWSCLQASVDSTGTNSAPVCTASGGGSCHPGAPSYTCSKPVSVSCSDADGDPVTISWSGCASGSGTSSTCSIDKIGSVTATATGSDGWTNSAPSNVSATGTDHASVENYGIAPIYSTARVEIPFGYSDADGDPLESCTATCTDGLGLACCTIINCRVDQYGAPDGAPGHVIYKDANHGADGKGCSMHLTASSH